MFAYDDGLRPLELRWMTRLACMRFAFREARIGFVEFNDAP
jgi:hypothetical protein